MPKSYKDILPILKEIKEDIARILNTKDFELIVFGSYARGEAREDSDLDLLVITNKKINWKEEHRLIDELLKKYLNKNLLISIVLKNKEEKIDPLLLENIKEEGVKV